MDPKIGWYQSELESNAYNIWNDVLLTSYLSTNSQPLITSTQTKIFTSTTLPTVTTTTNTNGTSINSSNVNSENESDSVNGTPNVNIIATTTVIDTDIANKDTLHTTTATATQQQQQQIQIKQQTSNRANKASTFGFNFPNNKDYLFDKLSTPWIPPNFNYDAGLVGLHQEILLFNNYISPTLEELYMRNEIICKLSKIIKSELPNAEVDVFGSYKTGLFLPTSDIDMVVFGTWDTLPLSCLKEAIIREQISDDDNIKVLDKASVPIIKIIEIKTELKVDISFNTSNGLKSATRIKQYLNDYPALRPLVMVLKQYLIQCDYNEVWTGGIGSYSLILMTVNFLLTHQRINPHSSNVNLGILLIEFFELYGKNFNYVRCAIRVRDGGYYLPKEQILKQFSSGHASILCIEDPLNYSNDIGKGSYGALKVKQAFEYAYYTLMHSVLPQNKFILNNNKTILGRIIRITKDVLAYRNWIKETYKNRVQEVLQISRELYLHQQQQQHQQTYNNGNKIR